MTRALTSQENAQEARRLLPDSLLFPPLAVEVVGLVPPFGEAMPSGETKRYGSYDAAPAGRGVPAVVLRLANQGSRPVRLRYDLNSGMLGIAIYGESGAQEPPSHVQMYGRSQIVEPTLTPGEYIEEVYELPLRRLWRVDPPFVLVASARPQRLLSASQRRAYERLTFRQQQAFSVSGQVVYAPPYRLVVTDDTATAAQPPSVPTEDRGTEYR